MVINHLLNWMILQVWATGTAYHHHFLGCRTTRTGLLMFSLGIFGSKNHKAEKHWKTNLQTLPSWELVSPISSCQFVTFESMIFWKRWNMDMLLPCKLLDVDNISKYMDALLINTFFCWGGLKKVLTSRAWNSRQKNTCFVCTEKLGLAEMKQRFASTPLKIIMELKNGGLDDDFPFQLGDSDVPR